MRFLASICIASLLLVACGGGGGGGSSVPSNNGGGSNVPAGTGYNLNTAQNVQVTTGSNTVTFAFSAATAGGSVSIASSTGAIGGTGSVLSTLRKPQSATSVSYISITANSALTIAYPTITTTDSTVVGVAVYLPNAGGWNYTLYEGTPPPSGTSGPFTASGNLTLGAGQTAFFALFSGTPSSGDSNVAYNCPTSQSSLNSVGRASASSGEVHKLVYRHGPSSASTSTGLIAVEYDRATYQRSSTSFTQTEMRAGGALTKEFDFSHAGKVVHVLKVSPSNQAAVMASLKAQTGVLSVTTAGQRRYLATSTPFWSNDPYFQGFTSAQITAGGATGAQTFEVPPYAEDYGVPGQWDMHAIGMEYAYGYASAPYSMAAAQGLSSVNIAIIDTGVDATQGDLAGGKVAYQKCFITSADGSQSTSNFATDSFGHGTDVAGIAAADFNNGVGFAGAGGNSSIYAYRVFPTFDENCANDNSTDPQCGAADTDIASAIADAINTHAVSVISISLGGEGCGGPGSAANGDDDPIEGDAIQDAINAGIIVVAASGNNGTNSVSAPACDAGVIAVGATGLDDGQPNGVGPGGNAGGTSMTPVEYVSSYSEYGTTNTYGSSTSWGIVAPGGDSASDLDNDDLHWIENIWTSTPFASDDAGNCNSDFPNDNGVGTPDCRILIEGTSQATPHVSGVVALVCAMKPSDCTAGVATNSANMLTLLCTYADNLTASTSKQGCGRLSARKVIGHLAGDPSP